MVEGSKKVVLVLGVYRSYNNRYRTISHSKGGKQNWTLYFVNGFNRFCSKHISPIEVPYWKAKRKSIQSFQCTRCGYKFKSIKGSKPDCPQCQR